MARPIESVEDELNFAFSNSSISLSQIEDRLIVRGQTPDTAEMSQIIQVLMARDSAWLRSSEQCGLGIYSSNARTSANFKTALLMINCVTLRPWARTS